MGLEVSLNENISIRPIEVDDVEFYFRYGFEEASDEIDYYTGTTQSFTFEQIQEYVKRIVNDKTRRDYLIFYDTKIIGEAVLNELIEDRCNFRICIFNKEYFSRGIGSIVTKWIMSIAFNDLGVKNVELEVYPFNVRGIALYEKIGFKMIDRIIDEDSEEPYRDVIIMRLNINDYEY